MERPDVSTARPVSSVGFATILRAIIAGVRLTVALVRDDRVATVDKLAAGAALAYLASPIDLVLDVFPVIGQLDDLAIVLWSWRRLLQSAGPDVIRDLWRGDDEALALLLSVAGVDE